MKKKFNLILFPFLLFHIFLVDASSAMGNESEEKVLSIPVAESVQYSGEITSEDQEDVYCLEAQETGNYAIKVENIKEDRWLAVKVYDSFDSVIEKDTSLSKGKTLYFSLEGGNTYRIIVSVGFNSEADGKYLISVGMQKPTFDITNFTKITDSIDFKGQVNHYIYNANKDGGVKISFIKESGKNNFCSIVVHDSFESEIAENTGFSQNDDISFDTVAGETYQLEVRWHPNAQEVSFKYVLSIDTY